MCSVLAWKTHVFASVKQILGISQVSPGAQFLWFGCCPVLSMLPRRKLGLPWPSFLSCCSLDRLGHVSLL